MRCPLRVAKTNEQKKAECDANTTDTSDIPHEAADAADDTADDAKSASDDTSSLWRAGLYF